MSEVFDSEEGEEREPVDLGLLTKKIELFLNDKTNKEEILSTLEYLCDAYRQLGEAFEENILNILNIITSSNVQVISKAHRPFRNRPNLEKDCSVVAKRIISGYFGKNWENYLARRRGLKTKKAC